MKLSELIALCEGDPVLMVEGQYGEPLPVIGVDLGVMLTPAGPAPYVLLEPANDEL